MHCGGVAGRVSASGRGFPAPAAGRLLHPRPAAGVGPAAGGRAATAATGSRRNPALSREGRAGGPGKPGKKRAPRETTPSLVRWPTLVPGRPAGSACFCHRTARPVGRPALNRGAGFQRKQCTTRRVAWDAARRERAAPQGCVNVRYAAERDERTATARVG